MVREDLIAQLSGMLFQIVPAADADSELSLEDVEAIRHHVTMILDRAQEQVVVDAQMTAEDFADERYQEAQDCGLD